MKFGQATAGMLLLLNGSFHLYRRRLGTTQLSSGRRPSALRSHRIETAVAVCCKKISSFISGGRASVGRVITAPAVIPAGNGGWTLSLLILGIAGAALVLAGIRPLATKRAS